MTQPISPAEAPETGSDDRVDHLIEVMNRDLANWGSASLGVTGGRAAREVATRVAEAFQAAGWPKAKAEWRGRWVVEVTR